MPDEIRGKWTAKNSKWINNYTNEALEFINAMFSKKIHYQVFFRKYIRVWWSSGIAERVS